MLKIDFYFWGSQCPHNDINKKILDAYTDDERYKINYHDISDDFELAEKMNLFSPTLLVFNDTFRWNGPIKKEQIEAFEKGEIPYRKPYKVNQSDNVIKGILKPLDEKSVFATYQPCARSFGESCCVSKSTWIKNIKERYGLKHLGYLHYVDGECVGGAEFVPSLAVPYNIPKKEDIAFLTCSYLSGENVDYKGYPLEKLESELPGLGYKDLLTIASEEVVFPNGPLEWFEKRGYIDLGEVSFEQNEGARLHLLKKDLQKLGGN